MNRCRLLAIAAVATALAFSTVASAEPAGRVAKGVGGFQLLRGPALNTVAIVCAVISDGRELWMTCARRDDTLVQIDAEGPTLHLVYERFYSAPGPLRQRPFRAGQWWAYKTVFGCHARERDLTCWNKTGHGFRMGYGRGIERL